MGRAVTVVAQPFVLQHDAQHERDKHDDQNDGCKHRHRILHQAGGYRAGREKAGEIARGSVIGLELPPARGHVVMIATPCRGIVRVGFMVVSAAVFPSEQAGDNLQASQHDRRDSEHRMHGAAEAAAGRQRHGQADERQADCQVKTEFVNAEPPPDYIFEPDFLPDAIERWFWFSESDRDDAERHQHDPDPDHQDGVVIPVDLDRSSQEIEIYFGWDMRLVRGHCRPPPFG